MSQAKNILITLPTDDAGHYYQDDLIQAFDAAFKAQRVKEVEATIKLYDRYIAADVNEDFGLWLDQRKKELE